MKKTLFAVGIIIAMSAHADEMVRGYIRADGTYVAPHMRSSPDGNPYNNYSTKGNVNPYTGQPGTVAPQPTYQPYLAPQLPPQPQYPYPAPSRKSIYE